MKLIDVTPDSYAEYNEDSNEKDPKFKFNHRVRISKYKKKNCLRYILKIDLKKFLSLAKLKTQLTVALIKKDII